MSKHKKEKILEKLRPIIGKTLGVDESKIVAEADLRRDFKVQNDDISKLAEPINEAFGCGLQWNIARRFTTVASIVGYIASHSDVV